MRVACLFSGGKDSNYALSWAMGEGMQVSHLVTVYSEDPDSYMYQTAGIELAELAAVAVGIPQVKVWTRGIEGEEVQDLKEVLDTLVESEDIEGIVSGALRSEYQRSRIGAICSDLGVECLSPVWHKDAEVHLRTVIGQGYDILVVAVSAEGLGREWLGKRLDAAAVEELKAVRDRHGINIDGEGGEFETMVLDAPHYRSRVVVDETEVVWRRDSGRIVVRKAHLEQR